ATVGDAVSYIEANAK
ncbi:MAG TPA: hypothetical protein PLF38_08610, partial [Xylanibacter oryzae]|nr:hypothetical protein [Xylanibacter oryzae]